MMQALGISEAVWDELRVPTYIGHDLDESSRLYVDLYIAIECFHMLYPEYMRRTTARERQLYQLFLALKGAKEKHAQWHAEHDRKATQLAREAIDINARP